MHKRKIRRILVALAIGFAVAVIVTAVAVWLEVAPKLLQSESGIVRTLAVWGVAARLNLPFISTDYMIDAQVWSSLQGPLDPVKAGAVYWDVVRAFDTLPPRKKREFVDSLNKLISKIRRSREDLQLPDADSDFPEMEQVYTRRSCSQSDAFP